MRILTVPCLQDNYAYIVAEPTGSRAAVVDPSEPGPVLERLRAAGLKLEAILSTHHHADHTGGNEGLAAHFPDLRIYGHRLDLGRIPGQTDAVEDGDRIEVIGLTFSILHVPGHTRGAVAYLSGGALFTGDTLFGAGCGRLFEGTAAQLCAALNLRMGALPETTALYCGHEYTAKNLRFARSVEPNNACIGARQQQVEARLRSHEPSVPSTLAEEKATNPFLRLDSPEIQAQFAAKLGPEPAPSELFGALRSLRDRF